MQPLMPTCKLQNPIFVKLKLLILAENLLQGREICKFFVQIRPKVVRRKWPIRVSFLIACSWILLPPSVPLKTLKRFYLRLATDWIVLQVELELPPNTIHVVYAHMYCVQTKNFGRKKFRKKLWWRFRFGLSLNLDQKLCIMINLFQF
jgi:hypothetical protein